MSDPGKPASSMRSHARRQLTPTTKRRMRSKSRRPFLTRWNRIFARQPSLDQPKSDRSHEPRFVPMSSLNCRIRIRLILPRPHLASTVLLAHPSKFPRRRPLFLFRLRHLRLRAWQLALFVLQRIWRGPLRATRRTCTPPLLLASRQSRTLRRQPQPTPGALLVA
jgi:hypothetical protein